MTNKQLQEQNKILQRQLNQALRLLGHQERIMTFHEMLLGSQGKQAIEQSVKKTQETKVYN